MAGSPPQNPHNQGGQGYPQQQPQGQPQQHPQPQHDPNAPYGVHPGTGIPYSDKQKLVAGLLQILLSGFAVGRFYTGHIGIAVAQLAVTWLTCGVGAIWPLIDGIMMLVNDDITDAEGRPLRPN